jgi:hypothetical protein
MRRAIALGLIAPALAACGGGGAATSKTPTGLPLKATSLETTPRAPADPEELVLNSDDLGDGWILVPAQTKAISLQEALKGDRPEMAKIERPAYRSGYQALYANLKKDGVLAQIYRYASPALARRIFLAGLRSAPREKGVKAIPTPAGAPTGAHVFRGAVKQDGRSVPAYLIGWQRGTDIATVFVLGSGVSATQAAGLARKQDRRMELAAAPAA